MPTQIAVLSGASTSRFLCVVVVVVFTSAQHSEEVVPVSQLHTYTSRLPAPGPFGATHLVLRTWCLAHRFHHQQHHRPPLRRPPYEEARPAWSRASSVISIRAQQARPAPGIQHPACPAVLSQAPRGLPMTGTGAPQEREWAIGELRSEVVLGSGELNRGLMEARDEQNRVGRGSLDWLYGG